MKPRLTLRQALEDEQLLGGFLSGLSWSAWRVMLLAAMGEDLKKDELALFKKFTGRDKPPKKRVDELWCVIGRRGGKSRAIAALAVYLAGLCQHPRLTRGERGVVLLMAPDTRQAQVLLSYCEGALTSTPMMRQLLKAQTADTLTLTNNIRIEVRSASFRRIRGLTAVAVLADECAFWLSEDSSNPDTEILNAARPALATTGGPLIAISSPYARRGALWETFKRHFGADGDPAVLVVHAGSRDFNPELSQSVIDRAMERDAAAAGAEFMAQFRTDVEGYITLEAVEACVSPGIRERVPDKRNMYVAFVDPSGGSSDSMTIGIAHCEGKTSILDCVRECRAPFNPESVVDEFAALLRSYRCSSVVGDRYAGEWPREQFQKRGVFYEPAEQSKSDIYRDLLPIVNSGGVDLLEHDRLKLQLVGLERRTARGGRDSIDHAPGAHDDVANAAAGAVVAALKKGPGVPGFRGPLPPFPKIGFA
jgi:hypothetical protein